MDLHNSWLIRVILLTPTAPTPPAPCPTEAAEYEKQEHQALAIIRFTSSSGCFVSAALRSKVFTSRSIMSGVQKAGSCGPSLMFFTPRFSSVSSTATACAAHQHETPT
eukprot:GHRQ01019045.1.p1 GENE.GHRQ01019045.1~~GHRQ01019045.1.p1  ORF type:complete len:108 (+),score=25.09 GHRQ01019045.1:766-1089(+)